MRIPLKWGTDSGEVGQRRSEATLVTAMISEVPHMSQELCGWRGKQHHFVSIISFLRGANSVRSGARFRWEAGPDYGTWGQGSAEVGQPGRLPPLAFIRSFRASMVVAEPHC